MKSRFVIVSPGRDEAEFLPRAIDSMVGQIVRPDLWIVVDDGSSDQSQEIVAAAAREFSWIRLVSRPDRGRRSVGPGVIEAFCRGLDEVDISEFDFVGKFDLDIILPDTYFSRLLEKFLDDPRLGSASGKAWFRGRMGEQVDEVVSDDMSVGAAKFYRSQCFRDIGGLVHEVMWDGIDVHRARMLGWKVSSFRDLDLRFEHLRPMGSSQRGILVGRTRHGYGQWFMGTSLAFIAASALFRLMRWPWVVGSAAMLWGFGKAMLLGQRRYEDPEFRRFLRRYQRCCLLRGKARAVAKFERAGEAIWLSRRGGEP